MYFTGGAKKTSQEETVSLFDVIGVSTTWRKIKLDSSLEPCTEVASRLTEGLCTKGKALQVIERDGAGFFKRSSFIKCMEAREGQV